MGWDETRLNFAGSSRAEMIGDPPHTIVVYETEMWEVEDDEVLYPHGCVFQYVLTMGFASRTTSITDPSSPASPSHRQRERR